MDRYAQPLKNRAEACSEQGQIPRFSRRIGPENDKIDSRTPGGPADCQNGDVRREWLHNDENSFSVKQIGALLIIIGIFLPLVCYPFTEYPEYVQVAVNKGIVRSSNSAIPIDIIIRKFDVVIVSGTYNDVSNGVGLYDGRIAFPYRYAITIGMIFSFSGLSLIAARGKNKSGF